MRFHTDTLTIADLHGTLREVGLDAQGVYLSLAEPHNSRSHKLAYEVRLRANDGKDRFGTTRRAPMYAYKTGEHMKAATYREWGIFMAALFEADPNATFGKTYESPEDFHQKTRYEFA